MGVLVLRGMLPALLAIAGRRSRRSRRSICPGTACDMNRYRVQRMMAFPFTSGSRSRGHASITTTQRYMNARASSLAQAMRRARERCPTAWRVGDEEGVQVG